jgi:hypothetical protein
MLRKNTDVAKDMANVAQVVTQFFLDYLDEREFSIKLPSKFYKSEV